MRSLIVAGLALVTFITLALLVHFGYTLGFDRAVLQWANSNATPALDLLFGIGTNIGGIAGVITLTAGMVAVLVLRKQYIDAIIAAATVAGASLLSVILKLIVERARPDLWEQLIVETSFSFPSGHAIASSALALSAIVIFWHSRWRWWVVVIGALFMLFIGASRLYLGVHYPTDILGGWLVSLFTVSIVYYGVRQVLSVHKKPDNDESINS